MPEGTLCNKNTVDAKEYLDALLADKSGKIYYEEMERLDVDKEKLKNTLAAIAAKDLRAGQVVLTDIQTEAGKTLVLARSRLTPVLLLRVANFAQFNPIQEPIYIETLAGAE